MSQNSESKQKLQSQHALLALLGQTCYDHQLLEPFHRLIQINQKTVAHSPTDKLQDGLLTLLMGNQTIYQTNTTLSSDPALWQSWGRTGCADQSGIQRTLEACQPFNVTQLAHLNALFVREHSRTARHDYSHIVLVLDGDLTGLPCSKHYQAATTGYFADCPPGTTGRQLLLLRFSAAAYNEIIAQQVFPGNTGSSNLTNFKQVLTAAWVALGLELETTPKSRVLIRLDAGFGTADIINYLLEEGYQFVLKLFSPSRALKLCRDQDPSQWHSDPKQSGRQAILLENAPSYPLDLAQQVVQIGVRCRLKTPASPKPKPTPKAKKAQGSPLLESPPQSEGATSTLTPQMQTIRYSYHVLVVKRSELFEALSGTEAGDGAGELKTALLLGQLHFYDQRAGMESASFAADKQGLALVKRRKRSLVGQEMLIGLAQFAHNLLMWFNQQLSQSEPKIAQHGIKRLVRDWLGLAGRVTFNAGRIVKVRLPKRHELTRQFGAVLQDWAALGGVCLILHQT